MNPSHYNICAHCTRSSAYIRKFVFTPTEHAIGEHPLRVGVLDDFGNLLDSATVTLVGCLVAPSPKEETYVRCAVIV